MPDSRLFREEVQLYVRGCEYLLRAANTQDFTEGEIEAIKYYQVEVGKIASVSMT